MDKEAGKKLDTIIALLIVVAISSFIEARAVVLEHGVWKLLGF